MHKSENGSAFSQHLSQMCTNYYGIAGRNFIKFLVAEQKIIIPTLKKNMKEFISNFVPENSNGQVYRVAQRFALVAAAGELATSFGLTGWENGESTKASKTCFSDWCSGRGGNISQEEISILSQVKRFFEQHGESRFTRWDASPENKTIHRAGFRKLLDDGMEYFVLPETFKTDISTGFDHRLVTKVCIKHGLLILGSHGEATRSEKLPGLSKKTRCYRFSSKVLGEEDKDDE